MKQSELAMITADLSEIWAALKPIVEDMGETMDMSKMLHLALRCWEYKFWAPDEFPNKLQDAAERFVGMYGEVATGWLCEKFFRAGEDITPEKKRAVFDFVMNNALSKDTAALEGIRDAFVQMLGTVVNLIDGVIPEEMKQNLYINRGMIEKCTFIVVAKKVTLLALVSHNRVIKSVSEQIPMYEDYRNRKILENTPEQTCDSVSTVSMAIKASQEKRRKSK